VLLDPVGRDRGYFRAETVESLIEEHVAGIADHSQGIWTLLMLELWHREFVDQPKPVVGGVPASAS
jgi:asparagine synthase (glutamine-hydrolysing)